MKSTKVIASLALASFAAVALAPLASAETALTDSTVKFTDRDPLNAFEIIEPGTYETRITPAATDGKSGTAGELQINWVPNIKFGEVTISNLSQSYDSLITKFTNNATSTEQNIPHFVQVADTRTTGDFKLTVSMTTNFTSTANTLTNTRIQLMNEGKATNNLLDQAAENSSATGILDAVATGSGSIAGARNEIPATGSSIEILKTKSGYQNGSISSLVFDSAYSTGNNYAAATNNTSIKLFVPASDNPQKDVDYTAVLTWDLLNTL